MKMIIGKMYVIVEIDQIVIDRVNGVDISVGNNSAIFPQFNYEIGRQIVLEYLSNNFTKRYLLVECEDSCGTFVVSNYQWLDRDTIEEPKQTPPPKVILNQFMNEDILS